MHFESSNVSSNVPWFQTICINYLRYNPIAPLQVAKYGWWLVLTFRVLKIEGRRTPLGSLLNSRDLDVQRPQDIQDPEN